MRVPGWVYLAEAGDADAGGGSADTTVAGAGGDIGAPKDMLEAINQGLKYDEPDEKIEDLPGEGDEVDADGKPIVKPDAGAAPDTTKQPAAGADEKHANGTPKKNDKGEALDDKGAIVQQQTPKAKTAAELELRPEELKALGPKAQERFREVIGALKEKETAIATLTESNKTLGEARDTMIGILQETNTTSDQLSGYLEFNRMVQSKDPKDLQSALEMVERQRAALYQALGQEAPGVDLLEDFPDLQQKVTDSQITREDALELANSRRDKAASQRQTQQQETQQQTQEQRKQAEQGALQEIDSWTAGLSKSDIDYKAKEAKVLDQVDHVIKTYAPKQWLPTLKLLYQGITIEKAPAPSGKGKQPLRPSGAKPGAKAPQNMFEAMWGAKQEG